MTVALNDRVAGPYTMTGGETSLAYDFHVTDAANIKVWLRRNSVDSTLVLNTDYTVSGVGNVNGGTVTLLTAALAGDQYTVEGAQPNSRMTDLADGKGLDAPKLNNDYDALQRQIIELKAQVDRALKLSRFSASLGLRDLAPAVAGKLLGFDGSGNATLYSLASGEGAVAEASSLAAGALDDIADIAASVRSGVASKLVTGTPGANGRFGVWEAGGDLGASAFDVSQIARLDIDQVLAGAQTLNKRLTLGSHWDAASDAALAAAVSGVTNAGALILGPSAGHVVVGLREGASGATDSFAVVSGGGNYAVDSTFDTEVFKAQADGTVLINGFTAFHAGNAQQWQEHVSNPVATTSGTTVEFLNIPAGARQLRLLLDGVSISNAGNLRIQIGDAGGYETDGYEAGSLDAGTPTTSTSGFPIEIVGAGRALHGEFVLTHYGANKWGSIHGAQRSTSDPVVGGGAKTLSEQLDRLRIVGDGSFDQGALRLLVFS